MGNPISLFLFGLCLAELRAELDGPVWAGLGGEGAAVGLGDAAGQGEADAEAAGAARLVGAVEPVKELPQLLRLQRLAGVDGAEHERAAVPVQEEGDGRLRQGVLDRVVQQDGAELADGVFIAAEGKSGSMSSSRLCPAASA